MIQISRGKKRVFKQIDIPDSGDEESEEEYVPRGNYKNDSEDESSAKDSAPEEESDDNFEKSKAHIPEKSKLSRKRKVKTSAGKYRRKETRVATNTRAKGPFERLLEFRDNGLSVVNGKLSCRACSILDLPLKKSSIQSHLSGVTSYEALMTKSTFYYLQVAIQQQI